MRKRLCFTLMAIGIYRVGLYLPVPGLSTRHLGFLFYGSPLENYERIGSVSKWMTIFSQGIMPYISASIVVLMFSQFIPRLKALRQGTQADQRKFESLILGMTIFICFIQAMMLAIGLEGIASGTGEGLVSHPGWGFRLLSAMTMTTGTMILVWLAIQVTQRGLGNGILIFLLVGFLERIGLGVVNSWKAMKLQGFLLTKDHAILEIILRIVIPAAIILLAIRIVLAKSEIRFQKSGENDYGHQDNRCVIFPLRFNMTGVIPIYVSKKILAFAVPFGALFLGQQRLLGDLMVNPPLWYWLLLWPLIIIFTYFVSAVVFDGGGMIDCAKRFGFSLDGFSSSKQAVAFFDRFMNKTTILMAGFLCLLSVGPHLFEKYGAFSSSLSALFGARLLIVIAGSIELFRQICMRIALSSEDQSEEEAQEETKEASPWVPLLNTATVLEAQLVTASLRDDDIDAAILSTRTVGIAGSLGMWEATAPYYPSLTIHRRLGAGEVTVMVREKDLVRARRILTTDGAVQR